MTTHEEMAAEERQQVKLKKLKRLKKGFFAVNRCLFWLLHERKITKSEFEFIIILLHLENQYAKGKSIASKRGKEFFHSNEDICSYGLISKATLMTARKSLKAKGYIDFKSGHTDKATEYHILDIEGFVTED